MIKKIQSFQIDFRVYLLIGCSIVIFVYLSIRDHGNELKLQKNEKVKFQVIDQKVASKKSEKFETQI